MEWYKGALVAKISFILLMIIAVKAFRWRDLTEDELKGWYSPTDLCAIENPSITVFPQDFRSKNCTEFSRGKRRMHCGVGMGANNYPCYPPFGPARPSFKRGIDGYTNADAKPLLTAIERFIATNTTLFLLGDSTMRQKLQALECQITREIKGVRTWGTNMWGILPCETSLYAALPSGQTYEIVAVSVGPNSANCLKSVHWNNPPLKKTFENAQYLIERHNRDLGRNVFVVANMGLWYNDIGRYQNALPPLLDMLANIAEEPSRRNVVAWHETVSQHWISSSGSGYFQKAIVDAQEAAWRDLDKLPLTEYTVPHCCAPISNTSAMADWRNDIANGLLLSGFNGRYRPIHHFPQAEITRPAADLHTCNQLFRHDCTHYCYTPLLHQVLWHQISNLALDKLTI